LRATRAPQRGTSLVNRSAPPHPASTPRTSSGGKVAPACVPARRCPSASLPWAGAARRSRRRRGTRTLPTDPTAATPARTMAGKALLAPDWSCVPPTRGAGGGRSRPRHPPPDGTLHTHGRATALPAGPCSAKLPGGPGRSTSHTSGLRESAARRLPAMGDIGQASKSTVWKRYSTGDLA
jgi:hypothetical protein